MVLEDNYLVNPWQFWSHFFFYLDSRYWLKLGLELFKITGLLVVSSMHKVWLKFGIKNDVNMEPTTETKNNISNMMASKNANSNL